MYPEFQADKIVSLHTCVLYTAVQLESGAIFWWGVLPFSQRKKLLEKYTNKKKTSSKHQQKKKKIPTPISNEITVGSQVCMRKAPMYHAGSIGFTVAGGIPKVGQLLNAAWNITDTCRFKIIQPPKRPKLPELPRQDKQKEEYDSASMPPPPSPASSTCSDGSMNMTRRQKRSAPKEEPEKVDEEDWNLKEVIFVEDSRNMPIGRVIKVDGQHTVVHFPVAGAGNEKNPPPAPPAAAPTPPPPGAPGNQTPKKDVSCKLILFLC